MPTRLWLFSVQRLGSANLWERYQHSIHAAATKRAHHFTQLVNLPGGAPSTTEACKLLPGNTLAKRSHEVFLWHGCSIEHASKICADGFDRELAISADRPKVPDSVASMYGGGIHLSENSSRADEMASTSSAGHGKGLYCMLLCRVFLGEVLTVTTHGEATAQVIKSAMMESGVHDSVMGECKASTGFYRDFLLFDAGRLYPEYILFYQREEYCHADVA